MSTQTQGGRVEAVNIGVDRPAERIRLDVANKNHSAANETRVPQRAREWDTLPALLLGLVVVTLRRRMAGAAV